MTNKKNWQQRQQEAKELKMFKKINRLSLSAGVNKFGTTRQQVATKMLPVLPAKTRAVATIGGLETRVNTGLHRVVANVVAVATCKATSLNSLFTNTAEAYPS